MCVRENYGCYGSNPRASSIIIFTPNRFVIFAQHAGGTKTPLATVWGPGSGDITGNTWARTTGVEYPDNCFDVHEDIFKIKGILEIFSRCSQAILKIYSR